MAQLRGGTTIGGFLALHTGLKEAYLGGNLTVNGNLNVGGTEFTSNGDNSLKMTTNSGYIEMGPKNTSYAHIYTDRPSFYFNRDLRVNGSVVWHSGNLANPLQNTDSYMALDTAGSSTYPRMVPKNAGSSPTWVRVNNTDTGILPYSNGNSSIGTSSWKFREMHAVNFYENGTLLSSKYAASGHNHDSDYLKLSGGTLTGQLKIGTGTLYSVPGNDIIIAGNHVTLEGVDRISIGANDIMVPITMNGETTFARDVVVTSVKGPRILVAPQSGNITEGGYFEFLESPGIFSDAASYGFRFNHDALANEFLLQSTAASAVVDVFTVARNSGTFTINSSLVVNGPSTFNGDMDMKNKNINNINHLTFNDPGSNEGIEWLAGNGFKIVEAPDNMTNSSGNLQFAVANEPKLTVTPDGHVIVQQGSGALKLAGGSNNHVYMEFYARGSTSSTRSAYMGYASSGSNVFVLNNQISGGDINLSPGSGGQVQVAGRRVYAHWDNVKWGTGAPSGGSDGDLYIQY